MITFGRSCRVSTGNGSCLSGGSSQAPNVHGMHFHPATMLRDVAGMPVESKSSRTYLAMTTTMIMKNNKFMMMMAMMVLMIMKMACTLPAPSPKSKPPEPPTSNPRPCTRKPLACTGPPGLSTCRYGHVGALEKSAASSAGPEI